MKREQKFKMPNALICAANLSLSARRVGAYLYAYRRQAVCSKSIRELACLAGVAPGTVMKAINELADAGVIQVKKAFRFDAEKGHPVRDRSVYTCDIAFQGGYTLVPYSFLRDNHMAASIFVICLYLYQASGNLGRAFPSISRIMASVGVSNSTVCCALRVLKNLPGFLVQLCKKTNGAFSSNSYFVVTVVPSNDQTTAQSAAPACKRGVLVSLHTYILRKTEQLRNCFSRFRVTRNLIHKGVLR